MLEEVLASYDANGIVNEVKEIEFGLEWPVRRKNLKKEKLVREKSVHYALMVYGLIVADVVIGECDKMVWANG